jgi:RNA polymerase sigma-70 factor (ECF subfamily)
VVARRYAAADDAEDIAQEAALRAWRNRGSCRAPEQPWSWLATITHNEAVRQRTRKPAATPAGFELPDAGALDESLEGAADRLTLWPAVADLNARDRAIVLLHYQGDMSVAAIARTTGIPVGTVKVKLLRIRDKLRTGLLT